MEERDGSGWLSQRLAGHLSFIGMNDLVNYILQAVLGPINFYKGIGYLRAAYDAPYLVQLLETISVSDRYSVPVEIKSDVIQKGMEELKRILDIAVDNYQNVTEKQKLACKCGNTWFVDSCYRYIMSRCRVINHCVL